MILYFIICRFIVHGAGVSSQVAHWLLFWSHGYLFLLVFMRRLFHLRVGKCQFTTLPNCLERFRRLTAPCLLLLTLGHLTGVSFETFIKIRLIWSVSRMKLAGYSLLFQLIEYNLGSLNLIYRLRHRCRSYWVTKSNSLSCHGSPVSGDLLCKYIIIQVDFSVPISILRKLHLFDYSIKINC